MASSAYRNECRSEKFFCNCGVGRLRTSRIPHCRRRFVGSIAESGSTAESGLTVQGGEATLNIEFLNV
jgi:hypothetical protein